MILVDQMNIPAELFSFLKLKAHPQADRAKFRTGPLFTITVR